MSKDKNIILSSDRKSFKCNGRWVRNRSDWVKSQEGSDEVVPVKIVSDGMILFGLKNKTTGAYFWEGVRKPGIGEDIEFATKDFLSRKKNPIYIPWE